MKILLIGSSGRMGRNMQEVLKEKGIGYVGIDKNNRQDAENCQCDVILDFSSASCLHENLLLAERKRLPIVVATTNHTEENIKEIERQKSKIAIFLDSNFSELFHVMLKFIKQFQNLQTCDFVVQESHHKHRKDTPSGSCKQILKEFKKYEISPTVSCFRVGEVVGEHKICAYSGHEKLEISHTASNRKVFCEGAIKACEFVIGKSCGLYCMDDIV